MCSIFSVCSKRFSVILVSMISCNLLLASLGASSSIVRFHPLGVLSNGITLPVSILYANARSSPKQIHCRSCVMGLKAIRGLFIRKPRKSLTVTSACDLGEVCHLGHASYRSGGTPQQAHACTKFHHCVQHRQRQLNSSAFFTPRWAIQSGVGKHRLSLTVNKMKKNRIMYKCLYQRGVHSVNC